MGPTRGDAHPLLGGGSGSQRRQPRGSLSLGGRIRTGQDRFSQEMISWRAYVRAAALTLSRLTSRRKYRAWTGAMTRTTTMRAAKPAQISTTTALSASASAGRRGQLFRCCSSGSAGCLVSPTGPLGPITCGGPSVRTRPTTEVIEPYLLSQPLSLGSSKVSRKLEACTLYSCGTSWSARIASQSHSAPAWSPASAFAAARGPLL
jgi:hypothetical protein